MTLRNNLYTIESRAAEGPETRFCIRLNPECFIYKAHFPGYPITPGVCIVQMAAELLSEASGVDGRISGVRNAKFLAPVQPGGGTMQATVSNIKVSSSGVTTAQVRFEGADGTIYARISVETVAA